MGHYEVQTSGAFHEVVHISPDESRRSIGLYSHLPTALAVSDALNWEATRTVK